MTREKKANDFNYDLFRKMRKTASYTLNAAAEALGVETNTIFNWEKGKTVPNMTNIKKIENLFGVNESFFYKTNYNNIGKTNTISVEEKDFHGYPQKLYIEAWTYQLLLTLSLHEETLPNIEGLPKRHREAIQTEIRSLKKTLLDAV